MAFPSNNIVDQINRVQDAVQSVIGNFSAIQQQAFDKLNNQAFSTRAINSLDQQNAALYNQGISNGQTGYANNNTFQNNAALHNATQNQLNQTLAQANAVAQNLSNGFVSPQAFQNLFNSLANLVNSVNNGVSLNNTELGGYNTLNNGAYNGSNNNGSSISGGSFGLNNGYGVNNVGGQVVNSNGAVDQNSTFMPVNISENTTGYQITCLLPGISNENEVQVLVDELSRTLQIVFNRSNGAQGDVSGINNVVHNVEFSSNTTITRVLQLGNNIDLAKIVANITNGTLIITAPKIKSGTTSGNVKSLSVTKKK